MHGAIGNYLPHLVCVIYAWFESYIPKKISSLLMFLSLNALPEILNQLLLFRSSKRSIRTNFIIYYLYLKGHDSQMHHCSWPIKPIRPRRPKRLSLFFNPEKIVFYLFWVYSFPSNC